MPQAGGSWYFDFPNAPGSVNYVLAEVNSAASQFVDAGITITTSGAPMFDYDFEPDNSCAFPAHVRFLLQQKGDDLSGRKGKQYFRWWSNTVAYQLAPGSANLSASLTDFSQWTSVFGEKANASVGGGGHQPRRRGYRTLRNVALPGNFMRPRHGALRRDPKDARFAVAAE
jgi:hypothetical protein